MAAPHTAWARIAAELVDDITSGRLAPGARLAGEFELAQRFGVNRHTARRAIAELAGRGLVRTEKGIGTFVEHGVIDYLVGPRTRFSENVSRQQRQPSRRVLEVADEPLPAAAARAFATPVGVPSVRLVTVGTSNGRPVSLSTAWFLEGRFPGIAERVVATGSITTALRSYGVDDYVRAWTTITARLPDTLEALQLQQVRTVPVLVSESLDIDSRQDPVTFAITSFCADRVQLVVDPEQRRGTRRPIEPVRPPDEV